MPTDSSDSAALIVGALEPKPLSGLAGSISAIRFSPDGKILAAGGQDPFVQLWDVASGKELCIFSGHTEQVNAVALTRICNCLKCLAANPAN